ncbi:MAG TPA: efflux RND transporter periplasmic adaptor subunit [Patescibacteria group bacterium]|nr:efflux RND transporter periplasmic adaptor subunit [Patescibacteria group bacterium]
MDVRHFQRERGAQAGRSRSGWRRLASLLPCLALIFAAACARKQSEGQRGFRAVSVKTAVEEPVTIPDSSEYIGMLKSRHSIALNPQVDGQVTQIFARSGDDVRAGAPIMQIDPLVQEALVANQQAARAAQVANVEFAKTQWERAQKLYQAGVMSRQNFDQAKTTLDAARQQLRSLDAQVRQQQVQLHYYRVVAPTGGIIGDIPVRVGDRVTTSTLLTTIDQPGALELYVNVPVEREKDLRLGQTIQLLDSSGNLVAQTHIDFISPEVDSSSQSILLKAAVENPAGTLRTSQVVQTRVIWDTHRGLMIPVLAVTQLNGQYFAFVVVGNGKALIAREREIGLGPIVGGQYEVLRGLHAGDRVVVEGTQELADGTPVSVTPAAPSGNPSH